LASALALAMTTRTGRSRMPTALELLIALRQNSAEPVNVQLGLVREFERAIHNGALDCAIAAADAVETGRLASDSIVAEIEFFRIAPIGEKRPVWLAAN
jgi:hypothetical protein